jgi:hypothetical protein
MYIFYIFSKKVLSFYLKYYLFRASIIFLERDNIIFLFLLFNLVILLYTIYTLFILLQIYHMCTYTARRYGVFGSIASYGPKYSLSLRS